MTTPDELRTELHRVKGLTASNDRELQELMADTLISIADSLAALAASVYEPDTQDDENPPTRDIAMLWQGMSASERAAYEMDRTLPAWAAGETTQQIHQQAAETPEQQMMDAVRPTEAGQRVVVEGVPEKDHEVGRVTGFGSTEGRDYAIVDFPSTEGARIWVDVLMVVTEEPSHGATDEQFDLVVGDEADADPAPMPTAPRETMDPFPWTNDGTNFYSVPIRLNGEWSTFAPREGKPAKSKKAKKKAKG